MIRAASLWTHAPVDGGPSQQIAVAAPSKLNLYLEIVGRRPDGYHDLETVFQEISLHDELKVRYTPQGSGLFFQCDSRELKMPPGLNLVEKAVMLFCQEFKVEGHFEVKLNKEIPIGAGLGGGSSDAAAALLACAWLTHRLHDDAAFKEKLFVLAAQLGADVAFFLKGGTCLGTGLGDCLESIPGPRACFVLVFPGFPVATAEVYKALSLPLTNPQSIRKIKQFLLEDSSGAWTRHLFNRLEEIVLPRYPVLQDLKKSLLSFGCSAALMSGSGSSVFGVVSSRQQGETIAKQLGGKGYRAWCVQSFLN